MRAIFISDTHGRHEQLRLPAGDLLVHAGDFTSHSTERDVRDFLCWFERQPHTYHVFICGNHETWPEANPDRFADMVAEYAPHCVHLHDSGLEIEGLRLWGSAMTPAFNGWAFNRERGADIRRYWDAIPENTDLLITHGPPKGFGDWSPYDLIHAGDQDLYEAILRVRPRWHVAGHFHDGYGMRKLVHDDGSDTILINASVVDEQYRVTNAPWVVELP